jgi:hypothetical protein
MKAAGYIFLGLLLAILLYASVERFTVTIQSDDKDTPPVVTRMDTPSPTSAMSTTATLAAPVGLTNSAVSLAPPLPAALQPPVPIPPKESATVPPVPDEVLGTVAPPDSTSRLAELIQQEHSTQNEVDRTGRRLEDAGRAWNALPAGPEKDAAFVEYSAAGQPYGVALVNLERIQNELGNLRR